MVARMHFVRAGSLEGFPELVQSLGCNPQHLLQAVDLHPEMTRVPDVYLPYEKVARLFSLAAERCREDLFGLKLARLQGDRALGLLGLIVSLQPTLGDGLRTASKSLRFHASGVALKKLEMGAHSSFELEFAMPEMIGLVQLRQVSIGLLHHVVQQLVGEAWKPQRVLLRQDRPRAGIHVLETYFGCPVVCNAELDGLVLDNRILSVPSKVSTHQAATFLDGQVKVLQAHFPEDMVQQVRQTIAGLLSTGECRLSSVAMALGLHPRVLQQRLTQSNTSFQKLVDEVRLSVARQFLQCTQLSMTDIALTLGYAELAVFSRSFKRWCGVTPAAWRRRAQA